MWLKNRFLTAMIVAVIFVPVSCGGELQESGGPVGGEVSIAYLKSLYSGHPRLVTENYVIRGYVISSDRMGNFYKTLVIDDGTGGLEIKVDMQDIFLSFSIGDEVEVYCNSLTLGAYGRLVQLGTAPAEGYETGHIGREEIGKYIARTGLVAEMIRPAKLEITDLAPAYISRLVSFSGVRFAEAGGGAKWTEAGSDTDRTLTDDAGNTLTVRTSAYAAFAEMELPEGEIYIEGILSWFGDNYQLRVMDP